WGVCARSCADWRSKMLKNHQLCADDETLKQLLLGLLPRDETDRLEAHVLACPICGDRLTSIEAQDTLIEAAHSLVTISGEQDQDGEVQRLIEKLCRIPMPTLGFQTSEASDSGLLDELQGYLGPPREPDELGQIGSYRVLRIL